jgi:hypothetical protein
MARPLQLMTHFSTSFGTAYNYSTELFSKFVGRKTGYFVAKGLEAHEKRKSHRELSGYFRIEQEQEQETFNLNSLYFWEESEEDRTHIFMQMMHFGHREERQVMRRKTTRSRVSIYTLFIARDHQLLPSKRQKSWQP